MQNKSQVRDELRRLVMKALRSAGTEQHDPEQYSTVQHSALMYKTIDLPTDSKLNLS